MSLETHASVKSYKTEKPNHLLTFGDTMRHCSLAWRCCIFLEFVSERPLLPVTCCLANAPLASCVLWTRNIGYSTADGRRACGTTQILTHALVCLGPSLLSCRARAGLVPRLTFLQCAGPFQFRVCSGHDVRRVISGLGPCSCPRRGSTCSTLV